MNLRLSHYFIRTSFDGFSSLTAGKASGYSPGSMYDTETMNLGSRNLKYLRNPSLLTCSHPPIHRKSGILAASSTKISDVVVWRRRRCSTRRLIFLLALDCIMTTVVTCIGEFLAPCPCRRISARLLLPRKHCHDKGLLPRRGNHICEGHTWDHGARVSLDRDKEVSCWR